MYTNIDGRQAGAAEPVVPHSHAAEPVDMPSPSPRLAGSVTRMKIHKGHTKEMCDARPNLLLPTDARACTKPFPDESL